MNNSCLKVNFLTNFTKYQILSLFSCILLQSGIKYYTINKYFFFLITLLPSSGILPTGVSPVADRYVYIPYIGLFFIIAEFLFYIYKKNKCSKYTMFLLFIITICVLSFLTYQRTQLWADNEELMTQAINYSPETADHAYLLRGAIYKNKDLLDKA